MKSKMMMVAAALAMSSLCLVGCDSTMKDADGNEYPVVKIGKQVWMAKNMNVNSENSWCYDNKQENCEKYGRLYSWDAAKKVCPSGWHLPNKEDFEILLFGVGSSAEERSENLRAGSWENGADKFGFSVLPAGRTCVSICFLTDGDCSNEINFCGLDEGAFFWTSSKYDRDRADIMGIRANDVGFDDNYTEVEFSVRCLRD